MSMKKIILASGSPRRKELLTSLGLPFQVITSGASEDIDLSLPPEEIVKQLGEIKAQAVAKNLKEDALIIGSDTTISFEGKILGKPKDKEEARSILSMLKNNIHQVFSGIAIVDNQTQKVVSGFVATNIKMKNYSDNEMDKYISSGEPMDKAGSYAIQGEGGKLVEEIDGCYNNVVGFPLCKLTELLAHFDIVISKKECPCKLPSGSPCPRCK